MKTFPGEAIGIGHPTGGAKARRDTRYEILKRLRLRSELLPEDFDNDWTWVVSMWDKARLDKLEGAFKGQWGVTFRGMVVRLLTRVPAGEKHVLADWMREQRRRHLCTPGLRL